eukprot:7383395-Prymnesium_polylepis.3
MATCVHPVKVHGICRPITQLAPRTAVAGRAVPITFVASVGASAARAPAAMRLAAMRLDGHLRMTPIGCRDNERRSRGIDAAADASYRIARRALGCRSCCTRPIVLFSAERACLRAVD